MTISDYDRWKTRSPDDERDRRAGTFFTHPADERLGPEPATTPTNASTADSDIDHTMEICAEAIAQVFEECAVKYEAAITAENELHHALVKQLEAAAVECRQKGQGAREWLVDRGKTAKGLLAKADESVAALGPPDFSEVESTP
jgi:hypothetical protein